MKKNNITILYLFIIVQPILDMLATAVPNLHLNLIVRGFYFLFIIIYLFKNKESIKISILLSILMAIYLVYSYCFLNYSIVNSISVVLKLFYLPFSIIFFSSIKNDNYLNKILFYNLIIYSAIYLVSYGFNIGNDIYQKDVNKIGFKGLFNSANELSAILVFLYYYCFDYLYKNSKKILLIFITVILLVISYLIGTKVLLGGIILIIFLMLFPQFKHYFKSISKNKKIIIISFTILFLLLMAYLFTYTNTYKNMLIQADFFEIDNIFSLKGINKVIFNDRLSFLSLNNIYYLKQPLIMKIFGIGHFCNGVKFVEMDIFDILYRYGIVGISLMTFIFIYFLKTKKLTNFNLIILILLLLISLTSGHVLFYPSVNIYIAIIFMKNNEYIDNNSKNVLSTKKG